MNYSFRNTFNHFNSSYGFKKGFSFNFSKSFMNSKGSLNFMKGNQGKYFTVNFSNKYFMTRVLTLNFDHPLVGRVSPAQRTCGLLGTVEDEMDMEIGGNGLVTYEGLVMLGDICLIREDGKWTCSTRLVNQSPVQRAEIQI